MGFGRGYQIFEENQHEKTMRPVRKIPPRCYFQFNMKVCKQNITLHNTEKIPK